MTFALESTSSTYRWTVDAICFLCGNCILTVPIAFVYPFFGLTSIVTQFSARMRSHTSAFPFGKALKPISKNPKAAAAPSAVVFGFGNSLFLSRQVFVDFLLGLLARAHGEDYGRRAGHGVSARVHAGNGGRKRS